MVRLNTTLRTGDRNEDFSQVPVIAVFTKYDQFKRDIIYKLEDQNRDPALLNDEMERVFGEHYLANLGGSPPFVRLEGKGIVKPPNIYNANLSVMQECTRRAVDARNLSKRRQMLSLVARLHSYSCRYKRII